MIKLVQYYFDGYNTDTTFSRWKLRSGDRDGSGYLEANWSLCPPPLRYLIGYVCLSTQYNQRLCWSMMIYDLCHFFFCKGTGCSFSLGSLLFHEKNRWSQTKIRIRRSKTIPERRNTPRGNVTVHPGISKIEAFTTNSNTQNESTGICVAFPDNLDSTWLHNVLPSSRGHQWTSLIIIDRKHA